MVDEAVLQGFDMKRQRIASLIVSTDESIELCQESKPVREALKANFGVSYREDVNTGGTANVRIQGDSYYNSPNRNMRRDELETR